LRRSVFCGDTFYNRGMYDLMRLLLPNIIFVFLKDVTGMGVGRKGAGGPKAPSPLDFENFSKKGCFLDFE